MEPDLIALIDRLLDGLQAKGEVELIEDFAAAIPIQVIGNLLNVPHDERGPLRDWSLAILGALEPVIGAEAFAHGNNAVRDFLAYLDVLVERRRAKPGNPERDVLTKLIQGEDDGERLTTKELLHNCIFLLNAGHETTTNLIGNGLVALSDYPDQKQRLLDNPALIKTTVEEILRFESSNQLGNRMRSERENEPTFICPASQPTARCTMVTSSVSPERAETMVPKFAALPAASAACVSVIVPAWLGFTSTAVAALLFAALRTRSALVTRKSSPIT